MTEIEVDFKRYLPDRITYINLHLIISDHFKMNINLIFPYEEKQMLANMYSGQLEVNDITGFSEEKISKLMKFSKSKTKSIDDYIM